MQHTLLPLSERRALKAEYRVRAVIVLCFMISLSGIIGIGAFIPAFTKATASEEVSVNAAMEIRKSKDKSGISSIESGFSASSALLAILSKDLVNPPIDPLVQTVVSLRGPLSITSLAVSRQGTTTISVVIQGVSPTRDALIAFKNRLASAMPGNKVDLPVSELAKSVNVQFSLKVIWALSPQ